MSDLDRAVNSRRAIELHRRCDEVLHYVWDPIGVRGIPAARDEYHRYLPTVFRMVLQAEPPEALAAYLVSVESTQIGLNASPERAAATTAALLDWREFIWDRFPE